MFFVRISYTLDYFVSSSSLVFRINFDLRTPLVQPNASVACFSFVRKMFGTSHERGIWMHAQLA